MYDDERVSIPGLGRRGAGPGCVSVVLLSMLTSAVVTVGILVAVQRFGLAGLEALLEGKPAEAAAEVVEVPDITSLPLAAAEEVLRARGLRLVVKEKDSHASIPLDHVAAQTPLAGSQVNPQSEVSVVVSEGSAIVSVPAVVGRSLADAKRALEQAGLRVGTPSATGKGPPGTVTAITPAPGTPVKTGSSVTLTVAPTGLQTPKLVGLSLSRAKAELAKRGLTLGQVRERYDRTKRAYVVLEQDPTPGSVVPRGATVDLVVNEGD
ncbi:MAG: PASTA domain-containing protein [Proteobacteria bacterium]|nr:PASTA domain-containing protein [Pseudomonadota bacterium]